MICIALIFVSANSLKSQTDTSDILLMVPNQLSYGLDKQLNIYTFNLLLNYATSSNFANFLVNQKYIGTAYRSAEIILQDDEFLRLNYDYRVLDYLSILSESDAVIVSNLGSNELNQLRRLNLLAGARANISENLNVDILGGIEDNTQMSINSIGTIFKIKGLMNHYDVEGYKFNGKLDGEVLSLNLGRTNKNVNFSGSIDKSYDETNSLTANFSYKYLDRFNALRREQQYIIDNGLNFDYSLESRFNDMVVSDINLRFGVSNDLNGMVRLHFSNNNISRSFKEYVPNDTRTSIQQNREQLRITVAPELEYRSEKLNQYFSFSYSYDSDINTVSKINSISDAELNILRARSFDLDNITSDFRILSRTSILFTRNDTLNISGISSITRFDTPSANNNSDRDNFLGIINVNYSRRMSDMLTFRLDAESQFNHQVNLKASRSASNFWMRSIKLAPGVIIQTKNFFMRPQPYVLANYTVYDFEGVAPGIRSFSLRQIGYNDSLTIFIDKNIYLGTRIDLIYKETGILLWSDFKETPVNGNLKFFSKFFVGISDEKYNAAVGFRYFNLTQKNFKATTFINSDYKTESYAPEVVVSADLGKFGKILLNGWYEFQIINDTGRNEIPNIIINTFINL